MILFNGGEVQFETFPNGETRVVHSSIFDNFKYFNAQKISFKYQDDSDLIKLMFVKNFLDTTGARYIDLTIYYMPYSRMDRSENGSPFTLKYVANFINSLDFNSVTIIEPHSDVTAALVNRSESLFINYDLINKVKAVVDFDEERDYIVFPDAGAQKRYAQMSVKNSLVGFKHRNFETGQIESLEIVGNVLADKSQAKAIIIDDLSSYGGTFVATANALRNYEINEVFLLVAHAENSIFKGKLFDNVDHVFTTDTILTEHKSDWTLPKHVKPKLTVYEIETLV